VAYALSVLGYPYVMIPAAIALKSGARNADIVLPLGLAFGIVAILTWRGVKTGRFSNFDVSNRTERTGFYRVGLVAIAVCTVALWMFRPGHDAVPGLAVATGMLAVASVVNRRLKISLHSAFAFFASAIPLSTAPRTAAALALFSVGVCWSRVELGRHTLPEVAAGALLGLVGGASLFLV
jgi:membrane-associated phospholipid phosphatase